MKHVVRGFSLAPGPAEIALLSGLLVKAKGCRGESFPYLSLRGTECRGNLGGALGECFVSHSPPSTEIASLRSQRQNGFSRLLRRLCSSQRRDGSYRRWFL